MKILNDITKFEDIKLLVDTFYSKVKDDLIGPIFNGKKEINGRNIWKNVPLLANDSARGTHHQEVLPPHKQLPAKEHFDRWMEIFTSTTDELFAGATAEEAKLRAKNMAEMFNYKITILEMLGKMAIF
jgi:hemoglobin